MPPPPTAHNFRRLDRKDALVKTLGEEKEKFEQISKALGSELSAVKAEVQKFTTLHEERVHEMNEALLAKSRRRAARRVYLSKKRTEEEQQKSKDFEQRPLKLTSKVLTSPNVGGSKRLKRKAKRGDANAIDRKSQSQNTKCTDAEEAAPAEVAKKKGKQKEAVAVKLPAVVVGKAKESNEEARKGADTENVEANSKESTETTSQPTLRQEQSQVTDNNCVNKSQTALQISVRPDGTMSISLPIPEEKEGGSALSEELQGMLSTVLAPVMSSRTTYKAVKEREMLRLSKALGESGAHKTEDAPFDYDVLQRRGHGRAEL